MISTNSWNRFIDVSTSDALDQRVSIGGASPFSKLRPSFLLPVIVFAGLLALSLYSDALIVGRRAEVLDGPQAESSQELWKFIATRLPADAVVVFRKPFVMSLYGNRTSNVIIPYTSLKDLRVVEHGYRESGVTHFVVDTTISEGNIEGWLQQFIASSRVEKVWENSRFVVYGWAK